MFPVEHEPLAALLATADAAYAAGDLARARRLYEQILHQEQALAHAHSRLGAISAQTGDLDAAEQWLRQALELDPKLAAAHSNLGNILYTRGDYPSALEKYQLAAALDPTNPVFQDNLHAAYKKLGQLDRAVAAYKKARSLDRELARTEAKQRMSTARQRLGCGGAALLTLLATLLLLAVPHL